MPCLGNLGVASTLRRDHNLLPLVTVAWGQASRTPHGAGGNVTIQGNWESAQGASSPQKTGLGVGQVQEQPCHKTACASSGSLSSTCAHYCMPVSEGGLGILLRPLCGRETPC